MKEMNRKYSFKRSAAYFLLLLGLISCSNRKDQSDLIESGYKKIGIYAYIRETAPGSGFEFYAPNDQGMRELNTYLNKELRNIRRSENYLTKKNNQSEESKILKRRENSILQLIELIKSDNR
ncbi:hypothetical protein ACFFLM_25875 [Deinococcus oregonensis]|uniref:Lipoprotein n=1 Tax=Deinococcus oregonensis TaxID=1805970 RepID=A0ABV6B8S0_9DEIO